MINAVPPSIYNDSFFTASRTEILYSFFNNVSNVNMSGGQIINLTEPINGSDAATKEYVDTHGGSGNLTGPISAALGITSITSQTGIGTKFVVDNSPILINPNIGSATASSINISGQFFSTSTENSIDSFSGAITTHGGISAQKNIYSGGTCYANDFLTTSDKRLKSNINNIDYVDVLKFLKLKGYTYNLKNEKGKKYGVLAQELEELGLGTLVDNTDEYKKVSYNSFIPLMLESIKMIDKKIDDNNTKFEIIKKKIDENYVKIETIERKIEKIERSLEKSRSERKKRRSFKKNKL